MGNERQKQVPCQSQALRDIHVCHLWQVILFNDFGNFEMVIFTGFLGIFTGFRRV